MKARQGASGKVTRRRTAGVLLHFTSLPGPYGVGDFGPSAFDFVDALARARQTWWQVLPLGPVGPGHSPYQCLSAFAGNPLLISPTGLLRLGLICASDLPEAAPQKGKVDFGHSERIKAHVLATAWERFNASRCHRLRAAFEAFCQEQSGWLDDFAMFMAIREAHGGKPWVQWGGGLAQRRPAALAEARRELSEEVDRHRFVQFLFDRQLQSLRRYARSRGVRLIGDLPIFVSADSADVWARPHLFLLDRGGHPKFVAGVPPDCFSETGQRWGNPLYNWAEMARDGFAWWVGRVRLALRQADLVRIDHFRGFESAWHVPASAKTAKRGRWVKAPGEALFATLRRELGRLPFIAEDLGFITPQVDELRERFGLPSMRVLQFAFSGDPDSPHLPHNHDRNAVVYTGTHDNDTTAGWFASLSEQQRELVRRYAPEIGDEPGRAAWGLLRLAWASVADYAIAPLQDVLALDGTARMNVPGTADGNWAWRLTPEQLSGEALDRLAELTRIHNRAHGARHSKQADGVR